ncbi:hypothetical protein ACFX2I_025954 [Malus domestica]
MGPFSDVPSLPRLAETILVSRPSKLFERFQYVGVTGEAVEFLLSNCPVLERLSLSFAKDLVSLRVVDFHFNNVPMLVIEVSISKFGVLAEFLRGVFSRLSCQLFHIEILKLDIRGAVYHQNYKFPVLSNLKHLELLVDAEYCLSLVHLASLMNAAPNLQKLVLGLGFGSNAEMAKIEKAALCPPSEPQDSRNSGSNALPENEEENARDHVIRYLKEKVPSTVDFVCL